MSRATRGFGWIVGDHEVAAPGTSECLVGLSVRTTADVDAAMARAAAAGATIVTDAGEQPWGYAGAVADPDGHVWMVTSNPPPW
jgi:uncharacterized protein